MIYGRKTFQLTHTFSRSLNSVASK